MCNNLFTEGAEEEKMEVDTDSQQPEKVMSELSPIRKATENMGLECNLFKKKKKECSLFSVNLLSLHGGWYT